MWPELADVATVMGDEVATFADLLLLGAATGVVQAAMERTRRGLEAVQDPQLELSRDDLFDKAVAFRRARRLESGQDLRAWLAARQLTMDDWEGHLRRSVAAGEIPGEAVPLDSDMGDPCCRPYAVDLACSGTWEDLADHAARLWAAARFVGDQVVAELAAAGIDEGQGAIQVTAAFKPLADLGKSWCAGGLAKIRTRERALEEAARRCAGDRAVAARVLGHVNDWTEVRYDELALATRQAANEAVLCAREDGLDAESLAGRARALLERFSVRHDRLPVAVASLLEGALPGEAVGPVDLDGRWVVLWLRERRRPSVDDEPVRETAAAELLDEALDRAGQGMIRKAEVL